MAKKNVEERLVAKHIDRESLLEAVREEAKKAGGKRMGFRPFLAAMGLRECDVFKFFSCWNDVLRAAGVEFDPWGECIESGRLLADWGRVAREHQRIPNYKTYEIHGKYNPTTMVKRFGAWSKVRGVFREFAKGKKEWRDVVKMIEKERGRGKEVQLPRQVRSQVQLPPPLPPRRDLSKSRVGNEGKKQGCDGATHPTSPGLSPGAASGSQGRRRWLTRRQRRKDEVSFGAPLNLFALRYEPVNENGVIYLFGILAERLGFSTEAVRAAFPDCIAKRQVGEKDWRNVRIEFEYESRNFREHGHDPEGCDMIVCWNHNWAECPPELEVIALSEEIKRIG